jgi:hypothetical protein
MATFPILRQGSATPRRRLPRSNPTSLTLFSTAARPGSYGSASDASAPPPAISRSEKPATELVGIARLAASSPRAETKRGTEYFRLPVRSILNECKSERVPFRWTVNPYRGCEFGCQYCYARYTHGQKFPKLVDRYTAWYGRYGNAPESYRKEITRLVEGLRQKYGLGSRPDRAANRAWRSPQLELTWNNGG